MIRLRGLHPVNSAAFNDDTQVAAPRAIGQGANQMKMFFGLVEMISPSRT